MMDVTPSKSICCPFKLHSFYFQFIPNNQFLCVVLMMMDSTGDKSLPSVLQVTLQTSFGLFCYCCRHLMLQGFVSLGCNCH